MAGKRVRLMLEEIEGRLVPSVPMADPAPAVGNATAAPDATHAVLELNLRQLDTNRDGLVDWDYTVNVRLEFASGVVMNLTLEFAAGSTIDQAQQAALGQLFAQNVIANGWQDDLGGQGVHIGNFVAKAWDDVESGSASIIKINGNIINPPIPLTTRIVNHQNP